MSSNTYTVQSNATITGWAAPAGWSVTGAAGANTLLDNSDSTYITCTWGATRNQWIIQFTGGTIPTSTSTNSNVYLQGMQVAVKIGGAPVGTVIPIALLDTVTGNNMVVQYITTTATAATWYNTQIFSAYGSASATNYLYPIQNYTQVRPFTKTDGSVFNLGLYSPYNSQASGTYNVYEARIYMTWAVVNEATLMPSLDPNFYPPAYGYAIPTQIENYTLWQAGRANFAGVWSNNLPSGITYNSGWVTDRQVPDAYQMKIFKISTFLNGNFNPDTTAADIYDSGIVPCVGSWDKVFVMTTTKLENVGTDAIVALYRFGDTPKHALQDMLWTSWIMNSDYATTLANAGVNNLATNYSVSTFRPPVKPKLTATVDVANNRTTLVVQGYDNLITDRWSQGRSAPVTNNWALATGCLLGGIDSNNSYPTTAAQMAPTQWPSATTVFTNTSSGTATGTMTFPRYSVMPVVAGTTYAHSVWVKAPVTGRSMTVTITWYNAAGTSISTATETLTTTTSWQQVSGTHTAPALAVGATVQYAWASMAASEQTYVTGWVFRPHDATYAPAVGTQCLGGYHGGNWCWMSYWNQQDTNVILTDRTGGKITVVNNIMGSGTARTGNYPITVTAVAAITTPTTTALSFDIYHRTLSLLPKAPAGTPVTISGWAWAANWGAPIVGGGIGIEFYDKDNNLLASAAGPPTTISNSVTPSVGWTQLSCSTTLPAKAAYYKIVCYLGKLAVSAGAPMWFDDFQLTPTTSVQPYTESTLRTASGYNIEYTHPGSWYVIERNVGGQGWVAVKIGVLSFYGQTATDYDYIVPYGVSVQYRAFVYAPLQTEMIQGPYSDIQTVTQSASAETRWMLWDPSLTTGPFRFDMNADGNLNIKRQFDSATFQPLGRGKAIVIADSLRGRHFDLRPIDSISSAELTTIQTWIANATQLWLVRPWTGDWWAVRLTGDINWDELNTNPVRYLFNVSCEEIDVTSVI